MRFRDRFLHILVATHVQEARRGSSEGTRHTGAGEGVAFNNLLESIPGLASRWPIPGA